MNKNKTHILAALLFAGSLIISCTTEEMEEPFHLYNLSFTTNISESQDQSLTKVALYNSEEDIRDKAITISGWENSNQLFSGKEATYNPSSSVWTINGNYSINNLKSYVFFGYANLPSEGAFITMPSTKARPMTLQVTDITKAQEDILLGSKSVSEPNSGDVQIDMSHPYASVKFKFGNASRLTEVNSIKLSGVYSSGKTTLGSSPTLDSKSITQYTWTSLSTANETLEKTSLNAREKDVIATFVVIPQDLSSNNVVVTISQTDGLTMTKQINSGEWKAGYTTTYTLDNITTIQVGINNSFVVTNTGESKVYIRAAITGAWYDTNGNIVAPWAAADGTFTGLSGAKWVESGNYYYYSDGVSNSGSTSALFTNYTAPEIAPVSGAQLKLDVLVQAIPYNINKSCEETFTALN